MIIAVDFDGTIVYHDYPGIGREIPFAVETLKAFVADGHKVILWTSRYGHKLDEALEWCRKRGLEFYAVNSNYPDLSIVPLEKRRGSPKVVADYYIDDRNIGGLPEWGEIYTMVTGEQLRRSQSGFRRLFSRRRR